MVNEEVVGGLISGMERGESLKKAMITLFNAGYKKEEIEEAAALVNQIGIQTKVITPKVLPEQPKLIEAEKSGKLNSSQINPQTFASPIATNPSEKLVVPREPSLTSSSTKRINEEKTVQKVSSYTKDSSKEKMMIFLLVALLVFLVGILVAIFLFKDELVNFFSTFFV
jgi:hypothetical protein